MCQKRPVHFLVARKQGEAEQGQSLTSPSRAYLNDFMLVMGIGNNLVSSKGDSKGPLFPLTVTVESPFRTARALLIENLNTA